MMEKGPIGRAAYIIKCRIKPIIARGKKSFLFQSPKAKRYWIITDANEITSIDKLNKLLCSKEEPCQYCQNNASNLFPERKSIDNNLSVADQKYTELKAKKAAKAKLINILVNLNDGEESFSVLTSDLTKEYVSINSDYKS